MAKKELVGDGFESRRRNEALAFLVVKFLRAYLSFQDIRRGFLEAVGASRLAGSGLFEKVRELEQSLAFDLKERAHNLFRSAYRQGNGQGNGGNGGSIPTPATPSTLTAAIEARSIDSYIGTGYHLLLILRESLYQIDRYTPELEKEKEEIARIMDLAHTSGASFTPVEMSELEYLRALDEGSLKIRQETEDLARRMVDRCDQIFRETAAVLRRFLKSGDDNEILLLNLLRSRDLLEKVYGEGAAESIFTELCRGKGWRGRRAPRRQ